MRLLDSAEIIAVGSELLGATRTDTNSLYITARLRGAGIAVRLKTVVGDVVDDIAAALASSRSRSRLVIVTGGLGPTEDDLTREAAARVFGRALGEDRAVLERLRARFAARGLDMPDINRRQALVPDGAEILPNPNGTAPGLWLEDEQGIAVLLPGPPFEMKPMVDALVRDRLVPRAAGVHLVTRIARIAGRTESHVEAAAAPAYDRWRAARIPLDVTILASPGTIDLHLTARVAEVSRGEALLDEAIGDLRAIFGQDLYSDDGRPMEDVLGALLREGGLTIAVAESCTGGLLTSRLTDVPGSSAYVERGAVAYSNAAKIDWLGVEPDLIARHGAVSEPVALAMAAGIRARAGVTVGVGVTGIAGPGGGTPEKPVGTVAIAVDGPRGRSARTRRFLGVREQIKWHAASAAMDDVRRMLLQGSDGGQTP